MEKNGDLDHGSEINITDNLSESLEAIIRVKNMDPDPWSGIILTQDLWPRMEKFGSGSDPGSATLAHTQIFLEPPT